MTHLVFTEDRIHEPAVARQLNRNLPNGYRFGSSGKRMRRFAGRAARGARGFFSTMLEIITAAKIRRIERELRMRGVRYDSVKLDGDRFVADHDGRSGER
jgi:hypothetical protein